MKSTTVILGLGSNLGDRAAHLRAAIGMLSGLLAGMRVSDTVESPAMLLPDSPDTWNMPFLNLAVSGKTDLSPEALLAQVKHIEKTVGRTPSARWSPRKIDIDILAMENTAMASDTLTVPHAGLPDRDFALLPMAELVPEWNIGGKKAADLAREKQFSLPKWHDTQLVGILNVTPDSFSDGGKYFTPQAAREAIGQLIADGADIIDIGAESTRPGATPITPEEEWARLSPVLLGLKQFNANFSLDTRHALTAQKALDAGVQWINDVSGFADISMVDAVKNSEAKLVMMHSLGIPADKSIVLPPSSDVVKTLLAFARERFAELKKNGITHERLIFDPGIGFGKTAEQSRRIIDECRRFRALGAPLYYGHSRKSFLGEGDRDSATLAVSRQLLEAGVNYLRVHDVASHKALLREFND